VNFKDYHSSIKVSTAVVFNTLRICNIITISATIKTLALAEINTNGVISIL